jgi:hypothetical protein
LGRARVSIAFGGLPKVSPPLKNEIAGAGFSHGGKREVYTKSRVEFFETPGSSFPAVLRYGCTVWVTDAELAAMFESPE